jgi:predicted transcriptional regulator
MKPISVYVPSDTYRQYKGIAARQGRPVAELIREALEDYLTRRKSQGRSALELTAHPSGRLKKRWTRAEIADEMWRR